MKIEKVDGNWVVCDSCQIKADFKILRIGNYTVYLCLSCLERLKSLEIPKEKVYEWQWIYKEKGSDKLRLTNEHFTSEDEIFKYKDKKVFWFVLSRLEESKRVREE